MRVHSGIRWLLAWPALWCLAAPLSHGWDDEFPVYQIDAGIYRGGPPMSRSDYARLRSLGVRTILDLQGFWPLVTEREQRLAGEYGMVYRNFPICALSPTPDEIEAAFQQLLRWQSYPIYVHCQQNRDRTSLLIALYRVRCQGWAPQDAYREMVRFGLRDTLPYFTFYFRNNAYRPPFPGSY